MKSQSRLTYGCINRIGSCTSPQFVCILQQPCHSGPHNVTQDEKANLEPQGGKEIGLLCLLACAGRDDGWTTTLNPIRASTSRPPPPCPYFCSPFREAPSSRPSPCSSRSLSCDGSHQSRCSTSVSVAWWWAHHPLLQSRRLPRATMALTTSRLHPSPATYVLPQQRDSSSFQPCVRCPSLPPDRDALSLLPPLPPLP